MGPDCQIPSDNIKDLNSNHSEQNCPSARSVQPQQVMPLNRSQTVVSLADKNPQLLALFQNLDTSGDGRVDAKEISHMMALIGMSHGAEAVQEAISEADVDSDGFVEFDEFVPIMKRVEEMKSTQARPTAWNQLRKQRGTVLCWLTFPALMVILTMLGSIINMRYIASVGDAVRVANGMYDIVWQVTHGVGESECPPSLPNCSLVSEKTHWPGAAYLAAHYEKMPSQLVCHIVTVVTAFMIFPFQFWKGLRAWSVEKGNGIHKYMGRAAISLLIFVAMPTSILVAGGPAGSETSSFLGFFGMATSIVVTSAMGWKRAREKKFAEHRKWMTRCFGSMLGGFFAFRIALGFMTWIPLTIAWPILCWGSWTLGLALAELYLWHTAADQNKYITSISAGRPGHLTKNLAAQKV